ncbi:hypothetical protein ACROYT_G043669 [Oculina patagonica]
MLIILPLQSITFYALFFEQEYFQYPIEADGDSRWGGIWEAPRNYTFLSTSDKQTEVKMLKKFDSWDENSNLAKRMPRLALSNDLLLSSASTVDDSSGSLVYNSGASSASYLETEKPNPSVVRFWMREGARLSCNDLKLRGLRAGNKYDEDGFQMIKVSNAQYLPVYCDMTTAKGAFTLIVTSAHNNWTRAQVPRRNGLFPGLNRDYSILDLADSIKNLNNNGTFQYMMDANSLDGGLTEWSEWGRSDKLCEQGRQRRHKTCTNPKPRCGGKQCDPSLVTMEEKPCTYCPESGIRSYGDYCVVPNNVGCSPPDGTHLIFTKNRGSACNATDMMFVFDWDGVIHHKCSKKVICPQGNYVLSLLTL